MGSNTSKPNLENNGQPSRNDPENDNSSDPRSPTPEIIRTPLQEKGSSKHNITKNVDLRKTFENSKGDAKLIHNNPILSAVIKNHLQSYDPRSPTQDFERTPIVFGTNIDEDSVDKQQLRIQYENTCASPSLHGDIETNFDSCDVIPSPELVVPKNLCDGFFDLTLNETIKDTDEPLGSSTASNEALENNMSDINVKKPHKFLETNFEYVEHVNDDTSCDDVIQILDDDPRSPSLGIERTPIVISKTNLNKNENVEDMSDDTLIKVLQNTNAELRQTILKQDDKYPEGLLVYEDESTALNMTPKKSISTSNGCRTPLSCMKNKTDAGHSRSKSVNTLFDPKNQSVIPQKITKRTSHIPRLKSLSKQSKFITSCSTVSLKNISRSSVISGDCENTPPNSHRDRWDKDNSIVL
ncbi:hypothetical protein ACJJTC_008743 [Scirpophaga incertulas]